MGLTCAEVYTGAGDVLERALSVPDARAKTIVLADRERPIVARAGCGRPGGVYSVRRMRAARSRAARAAGHAASRLAASKASGPVSSSAHSASGG
jgi:hypothetical protein